MKKMDKKTWLFGLAGLMVLSSVTVVAGPKGPTLVDVAIELNTDTNGAYFGEFDLLIEAVLAADDAIYNTLVGNGQHTVFAPTDTAFENLLGELTIDDLPKEYLTEVLLYHVVKGRRFSEDVIASSRLRTLLGDFLFQDGGVLTDGLDLTAEIIDVDVEAANGVIHVINAVVLPYAP